MKKKDIFKIVSLLVAADALSQGKDLLTTTEDAEAAVQTQSVGPVPCSGGTTARVRGNFTYTTDTNYTFRVRRVDGTVVNLNPGTVLQKGDEVFVNQNNSVSWGAQVTANDMPEPPITPETTTACTTAITTLYTTDTTTASCTGTTASCASGGDDDDDDGPCFAEGTEILLGDGNVKTIKEITAGDKVVCFDEKTGGKITGVVAVTCSAFRDGMHVIKLASGKDLHVTLEHPLKAKIEGREVWGVIDLGYYVNAGVAKHLQSVEQLNPGDALFNKEGEWIEIKSIEKVEDKTRTCNIRKIDGPYNFYAGGFLASTYD